MALTCPGATSPPCRAARPPPRRRRVVAGACVACAWLLCPVCPLPLRPAPHLGPCPLRQPAAAARAGRPSCPPRGTPRCPPPPSARPALRRRHTCAAGCPPGPVGAAAAGMGRVPARTWGESRRGRGASPGADVGGTVRGLLQPLPLPRDHVVRRLQLRRCALRLRAKSRRRCGRGVRGIRARTYGYAWEYRMRGHLVLGGLGGSGEKRDLLL